MKKNASCRLFKLVAFTALAASASASDVTFYSVVKSKSFLQTDPVTLVVSGSQPYKFQASANLNTLTSLTNSVLTLPGGSSQALSLNTNSTPPAFKLKNKFSLQTDMDAAYPNGTYFMTNFCTSDGTKISQLNLTGDVYPNTPQLTNFSAAQTINATNSFTLMWAPFSGGTASDFIGVSINDTNGSTIFSTPQPGGVGVLDGTAQSVVIPAGTLSSGQSYQLQVTFAKIVHSNTTNYPGSIGDAAYSKDTTMNIAAVTPGSGLTLGITPSTISNTYSGNVTLNIGGIGNGETVVVKKFIDDNQNGIIDTNDVLVEVYTLTDGHVVSIGGARNINIPGDDDLTTNSQITSSTYYLAGTEASRSAGQFLYKVSGPSGTVTNVFTVTQAALGQTVSGTVSNGATVVPGAFVVLLTASGHDNKFVAGAVSDNSGNYSINVAPGSYEVIAFKYGLVMPFANAGLATLNAGQSTTINLSMVAATGVISGRFVDAVNTNVGVGPIQMFCESSDSVVLGFADGLGNFTVPITAGQWQIDLSDASVFKLGYLRPQNKSVVDATSGSATNQVASLTRGTALIYGRLMDTQSNAVANISISGNNQTFDGVGLSDANGNYAVAVNSGNWSISPDSDSLSAAGYISAFSPNFNVSDNQSIHQDFVVSHVAAHVGGRVVDNNGNPVGNVQLVLSVATTNGPSNGNNSIYFNADSNGYFNQGVSAGNWDLSLECNDAQNRNLVNPILHLTVVNSVDQTNLVLVPIASTKTITGTVQSSTGGIFTGLDMTASATINGTNYLSGCAQTDGTGHYQLAVANGTWTVAPNSGELVSEGYTQPPTQNVIINNANGTANFVVPVMQPFLTTPNVNGNQVQLFVNNVASGHSYTVQYSLDLSSWNTLFTTNNTGGFSFTDSNATNRARYYRVIEN